MKKSLIVAVLRRDVGALYIDGELYSHWFTLQDAALVTACGLKLKYIKPNRAYYAQHEWPAFLKHLKTTK